MFVVFCATVAIGLQRGARRVAFVVFEGLRVRVEFGDHGEVRVASWVAAVFGCGMLAQQ